MQMREAVRSGRKANFYITENSFIDYYAREVGLVGIAVYHVLERHMNCTTRSTWIGTAKVAHLLGVSQRTVQRALKTLEDLRLIKIMRTANMTTYVVMPVPQRAKNATAPLFDAIPDDMFQVGDRSVVANDTSVAIPTLVSPHTTLTSPIHDTDVAPYKEEQDLLNKTKEQDQNKGINLQKSATKVISMLALPATSNTIRMVEAALEAEAAYTGQELQEVAELIARAAMEDRKNGVSINKFYFEDTKWRQERGTNVGSRINRAEQRKLDNLEINARVKQRFRDRFGSS